MQYRVAGRGEYYHATTYFGSKGPAWKKMCCTGGCIEEIAPHRSADTDQPLTAAHFVEGETKASYQRPVSQFGSRFSCNRMPTIGQIQVKVPA